ncbi:tryptophan synthase beta subunit-like PLP-dependent enzyme [Coprinopsis marcescibilis]|uniref:L-serine ammonia-lyase n=1 Tax=Coprinopsis marcescibilis TaxID=230819 RepID=A0A5C3L135_COPMA|nr:tryptophan synthase beta subunit-like PLP-dependent enzyme [Coprinopsis marcescibilis]
MAKSSKHLWLETPLLYSTHLSELLGASVHLKLENLQPSYSFKYRGISLFIQRKWEELGDDVHFAIASGGNAGLAAACAAKRFGLRCTVFIPEGVSPSTLALLKQEKAEIVVHGKVFAEASKAAIEFAESNPNAVAVHPYNDPIVWEGHGSMIKEIEGQLGKKPDAIFCSVGGGGLLGGVLGGCQIVGWDDVPIVAVETIGSDCFYHSMSLNRGRFNSTTKVLPPGVDLVHDSQNDVYMAHFSKFDSMASGSLGASQPAEVILKRALDWRGGVKSISVPDAISMESLVQFADNQKLLVELSCATTLVPAYHKPLFDKLVPAKSPGAERTVVFIVCGGFKISLPEAEEYQRLLENEPKGPGVSWSIKYDDGTLFMFPK